MTCILRSMLYNIVHCTQFSIVVVKVPEVPDLLKTLMQRMRFWLTSFKHKRTSTPAKGQSVKLFQQLKGMSSLLWTLQEVSGAVPTSVYWQNLPLCSVAKLVLEWSVSHISLTLSYVPIV